MTQMNLVEGEGPDVPKKKKKKKVKRRYSTGLGLAQESVRAMNKGGRSVSKALAAYWKEWDEGWDRSSGKKRNGALIDLPRNYGRTLSKAMDVASAGPREFTRALPKIRKITLLRALFPPLWFVR